MAAEKKLTAIAVTDHDTTKSARKITGKEPVTVIPGIELSVYDFELDYMDVHVLGLFIDPENPSLLSKLETLKKQREDQKKETISKIVALGYPMTFEEAASKARGSVGRPHIAKVLVEKYPEDFPDVKSVFDRLIGNGRPAYVDRKDSLTMEEAVRMIHDAGGIAVLAHPFLYEYDATKIVSDFKNAGGDGMEVYYDYETNANRRISHDLKTDKEPEHFQALLSSENFSNSFMAEKGEELAERFGLLESGGSDFHGSSKDQKFGDFGAPDEVFDKMKEAIKT